MRSLLVKGSLFALLMGVQLVSAVKISVDVNGRVYPLENLNTYSYFGQVYATNLDECIDALYAATYQGPENARLVLKDFDNNAVGIQREKYGARIDKDELRKAVTEALSVGGGTVRANVISVAPDYVYGDLADCVYLRSGFTTYFNEDQTERASNISLAAKFLSGTNFYPGQILSFNDTVGERSEKRGFLSAKVIVGGEFSEGVGGGVCQVSTTTYNAALLSGLDIKEVHRHSLAVNYVKKSFDAMVSFGFADLKIKNQTDGVCAVFLKVADGAVKVKFFGKAMKEDIETQSVVIREIEPQTKTVVNAELAPGEKRYAVYPKSGFESEGYLLVTKNGVTEKIIIRKDYYKPVDGVLEVADEN